VGIETIEKHEEKKLRQSILLLMNGARVEMIR
jgi:hypothetical protein